MTINELVDIVEDIAGVTLTRNYNLSAPQGVRGRNSDNTLISERLGWAPSISLEDGLRNTYKWIFDQMSSGAAPDHPLTSGPVTAVHSGDGRDVITRPVGPRNVSSALASPDMVHCRLCTR